MNDTERIKQLEDGYCTLRTALHRREAEVAMLREALAEFGKHHMACPINLGQPPCDCGLDTALDGYSSSWLAEHDAKVRAEAIERCAKVALCAQHNAQEIADSKSTPFGDPIEAQCWYARESGAADIADAIRALPDEKEGR